MVAVVVAIIVVVVAPMARNFDSGALVVLVVTVVGAEVSCDTRFTVGDLTRAHALLQVPLSAAMLCGHGRDRGRVGGCSRNNGQGFWLRRWLSLTVIDHRYRRFAKGILPQEHVLLHAGRSGFLCVHRNHQAHSSSNSAIGGL